MVPICNISIVQVTLYGTLTLWSCTSGHISFHLLIGSIAAAHPRWVRGKAAWPLWTICCSHFVKSRPSSPWIKKLSCPTHLSRTSLHWVGSPVPSGATLLCLPTSSPKSSSYTCWAEMKKNIRLMLRTDITVETFSLTQLKPNCLPSQQQCFYTFEGPLCSSAPKLEHFQWVVIFCASWPQ